MRFAPSFGLCGWLASAAVALVAAPSPGWAQEDEDEPLRPGLIGVYAARDVPGETASRVDRRLAFDWGGQPPDPRLSAGPFTAKWRGYVMTQGAGEYRFAVYGAGQVTMTLAGERILEAAAEAPQWMDARPLELPFGWHPVEIDYATQGPSPRLALYWSGPQFGWEPVSERQLFHDVDASPAVPFERGEALAAALRCEACHAGEQRFAALAAPALDRLAGSLARPWLVDWLTQNGASAVPRRMPHFALSREEATAIADYLLTASEPPRGPLPKAARVEPPARSTSPGAAKQDAPESKKRERPSAATGERLALTLGCLACHRVGELGASDLFGGGDLSRIAEKRPAEFFERWLAEPASLNRHHRMPVFELSEDERKSLSLYLATLKENPGPSRTASGSGAASLAREGRRLVEAHRCGACHVLPQDGPRPPLPAGVLTAKSHWERACTGEPQAGQRPGYRLSPEDASAVREYLLAVRHKPTAEAARDARQVLRERNCLACHARDESAGLGPSLAAVASAHPDLAALLPAMTPPPLTSVGDKLHEGALRDAIRRTGVHRPYLAVRMPKFDLADEELQAVVRQFASQDQIPPRPEGRPTPPEPTAAFAAAGARLVTSDGFGCVSCHRIGTVEPEKAPLNARGPDLSLLSQRIRHAWFERWVRNPARIVPRMEMPAVQLAVRGVLNDDLDRQLAAVWSVLNTPGFEPPPPDPVRVLRRSGLKERNEWAAIGTDVLQDRGREYLKPLLIGLPNRHNVLFDLANNQVAGWWLGDAARQRTKGKTWYWESGGGPSTHLLDAPLPRSEMALEIDGKQIEPSVVGQFPTEADEWRHIDGGVRWRRRLRFAVPGGDPSHVVHVEETLAPIWPSADSGESGFWRTLAIRGVPAGAKLVLRAPRSQHGRIQLLAPASATRDETGAIAIASSGAGAIQVAWAYLTSQQPDTFPAEAPAAPPPSPLPLFVAPGFEAMQTPLPEAIMPTALAWTPAGTLAIASLKGEVWLARDTDGDGLEDRAAPFSDDLAAPYGLAVPSQAGSATAVDAINKYALLRLIDEDGDGRAERTVTLASGWGHTSDYHDWAVGLPRDEEGNYYVALPCQQDDRSPAAAYLRGKLLRLVPRTPTENDPHAFALQEVSAGHRFPMGLARRRDGELFVTDNQGNYNPFNELNHVIAGRHYGFINKLEQNIGFAPQLTAPAIDLPHPWTRSVNGICFLDTPPAVRAKLGHDRFGPFEGHLVGCEMNNRMLVRMTLHRVGDVWQGAAYPLTYEQPPQGPPFLGPLCAEVSPAGDLYVGSLLDSGWGGGNNIGNIVRLRPFPENLPAGIREVRAERRGLAVEFTRPVDRARAEDAKNYALASYTRISTPAYGGDDVNRRSERIEAIAVAADGFSAVLRLSEWRPGYVYELRLKNLTSDDREFFPAEAHYTLRQAPK